MSFVFHRSVSLLLAVAAILWLPGSSHAETRSFSVASKCISMNGAAHRTDGRTLIEFALTEPYAFPVSILAQQRVATDAVVRSLEAKGFSKITGLMRRGGNYVFQADNALGMRVRVVMNAETGEIVGLSPLVPPK